MPIVDWDLDADENIYVGSEEDGCYYQTDEGPDGWYVTVVVDSETGHFCEDIITDDGPYSTEMEAASAGRSAAIEWCLTNGVQLEETELLT